MIAIDTNILVYAHRGDSPWHSAARLCITELAESRTPWAIPWPCLHEFLGVVSHPRIYAPPTPIEKATEQIDAWLESHSVVLLSESEDYWRELRPILATARVSGPQIHDARVVALCLQHGVRELWTADRDFSRFPSVRIRNPLVR